MRREGATLSVLNLLIFSTLLTHIPNATATLLTVEDTDLGKSFHLQIA